MKILVYPHDLALGGSQLNAIDLAAAVSRRGHRVVVFGETGPLVDRIRDLGLAFAESPRPRRRPSPRVIERLTDVAQRHDVDIVHGYEWPPALEASLVAARLHIASVATVLSMSVADFLPHTTPLIVGTEQIADRERHRGRTDVTVLEPPVDLTFDDPAHFGRGAHSVGDADALRIVVVNRIVPELKLEGLLTACDVVGSLSSSHDVQLIVVGDGSARNTVQQRADEVNARAGRSVVVLTGEMTDPRPAYACADIVLGMGSSALRAMAFGKPVVVQGEHGFWRLLEPDSSMQFRYQGWYGVGENSRSGAEALTAALRPLLDSSTTRRSLGAFACQLVHANYSLDDAADRLISSYEQALSRSVGCRRARARDLAMSSARYGRYFLTSRLDRLRGSAVVDDFNSVPVAAPTRAARSS